MPAGAEITALRSNIPAISRHVFGRVDADFVSRAEAVRDAGMGGVIVAGENYGQGSSREHAALAPRHLGIRVVLAKSFARIHRANLINFGILPLIFAVPDDYERLNIGEKLKFSFAELKPGGSLNIMAQNVSIAARNDLSAAELENRQGRRTAEPGAFPELIFRRCRSFRSLPSSAQTEEGNGYAAFTPESGGVLRPEHRPGRARGALRHKLCWICP